MMEQKRPMMKSENNRNGNAQPRTISRRDFIKLAAAAGLLAGCSAIRQLGAAPTPSREEIIKIYPDVPSKVVHARHAGAWEGEDLVPEALRQMLDASIIELTGLDDAIEAWAALFSPDERIAIKVNTIPRGSTHVPLVMAVTERLQAAGVPAEQILIFDRFTYELENEGYPVNEDGPGVRCYGTDYDHYTQEDWTLMDTAIKLSDLMLSCDALINIPILKQARGPGISFAMKNHYGTFNKPFNFHLPLWVRAFGELNALPPIRERTRLIIGDVLTVDKGWDGAYHTIGTGDAILMSFDPVAHDTVGLQLVNQILAAEGSSTEATTSQATPWLEHAAEIGLGTNNPDNMDVVEIELG